MQTVGNQETFEHSLPILHLESMDMASRFHFFEEMCYPAEKCNFKFYNTAACVTNFMHDTVLYPETRKKSIFY